MRYRPAMRKVAVLLVAVGFVLAGGTPAWASSHRLSGSLTLAGPGFGASTHECSGSDLGGGYDDISRGAQVKVRNARGKVIAVTALRAGRRTAPNDSFTDCRFAFKVKVPDSKFYSIEVSHRGELTYSKKKLEKMHWKVALTLGG